MPGTGECEARFDALDRKRAFAFFLSRGARREAFRGNQPAVRGGARIERRLELASTTAMSRAARSKAPRRATSCFARRRAISLLCVDSRVFLRPARSPSSSNAASCIRVRTGSAKSADLALSDLPRVICCFDDVVSNGHMLHCDEACELLAIRECNRGAVDARLPAKMELLDQNLIFPAVSIERLLAYQRFRQAGYNTYVGP